jgi:hypothetical protein
MPTSNALLMLCAALAACGGKTPEGGNVRESKTPAKEYRRSPVLNKIMKNAVNKPFSKLTFFVFHSEGNFDFSEIDKTTREFHEGISQARAVTDLPVDSAQGREVFTTFLENLDHDCLRLSRAIASHDGNTMQSMLARLSRTCNNCHHFFRLDIADSPEQ